MYILLRIVTTDARGVCFRGITPKRSRWDVDISKLAFSRRILVENVVPDSYSG